MTMTIYKHGNNLKPQEQNEATIRGQLQWEKLFMV